MRSERYKTSEMASNMDEEDRKDFWSKNSGDEAQGGEPEGSFLKSLLIDIVIAVILAAAVLYFIRPTIVKQSSMEDTLHENDYMIMYR